jgi:cytochrome c biogenesis protein CcmG, thiol:disulfide interchange protein DsbE
MRAPVQRARAACLAVAALVVAVACRQDGEAFRPIAVGAPVPAYAARTLAGDTLRVGGAEPVTLLHVWATWCLPCQEEFPDIEQLEKDYGPRGLRIVAVSIDNGGDAAVQAFVRDHGSTFTIARDPEGSITRDFQIVGPPASYLIARDGTLLWRQLGAIPKGAAAARAAIEKALE